MAENGGKSSKGKNATTKGEMVEGGESSGKCFQKKIGSSFPKVKEHVSTKAYRAVGQSFAGFVKPDNSKSKINPAVVYNLWKERNLRIFSFKSRPAEVVLKLIQQEIKLYISNWRKVANTK
ncbi:hypothetical protein ACH5RR_026457 [Cinchona calisaya]|uniref:Uncharacterized protein n=1 Tax=Cinchona calisaya TaxID=153742 RepID=A0ABD2Z2N4_9GENT